MNRTVSPLMNRFSIAYENKRNNVNLDIVIHFTCIMIHMLRQNVTFRCFNGFLFPLESIPYGGICQSIYSFGGTSSLWR